MNEFKKTDHIAFRTIDGDNDVWCETVFIFDNNDEVNDFFYSENNILIDAFTEDDDRELYDFKIHASDSDNYINAVTFTTHYAGEVRIYRMDKGLICRQIIELNETP